MPARKSPQRAAQSPRPTPPVLPAVPVAAAPATPVVPAVEATEAIGAKRSRRRLSPWLLSAYTVVALSVILVVVIVVTGLRGDNGACFGGSLPCGSAAPDFSLPAVPGGKLVHLSDFRRHPVLLELFATWCPACHAEAPMLEQLDAANHARGLRIVSVVASAGDHTSEGVAQGPITSPADLLWFIKTYDVHHTVLYDPQVSSTRLSQAAIYHEHGFPTLYLLDGRGIIRWSAVGVIAVPDLQNALDSVLHA